MQQLETEVKFHLSDFDHLRTRLADLGAVCIAPRTFEHNARYESKSGHLLKNKCLLRLRKAAATTLTFKSPPPAADTEFKVYRELEVNLDDFETMDAILNALGYFRRQVYDKWRETWELNDVILCLDTMPFGRFLEIEGAPGPIKQRARELDLKWSRRMLSSYLEIFEVLREIEGLGFTDVTFDNFNSVQVSFDRYAGRFEVGDTPGPCPSNKDG